MLEHALNLGVSGIDTAYNYRGFTTHRALARTAADLIGDFTLSTKVGYFPSGTGERPVHSLDPDRLRAAVERSAEDLGRSPDVVFLHNPELALTGLDPAEAREKLAVASMALADSVRSGLCKAWGIATWDPRPVRAAIEHGAASLQPGFLLLRAGLTVAAPILDAAEHLCRILDIAPEKRWGMSPFSGTTTDPAWSALDLRAFFAADQECSTPQAAFRLAYELPQVSRVAVSTSNSTHLQELVAATRLTIRGEAVSRYRNLVDKGP
ncbi:aldo/keto reductase [Amycolatopsis rhizosphaerae]|uniref:aldo/keto reductase n=1 Tax=Amycolatopsis rhizosphaerae TaxID=2053003 RepID=UPI001643F98F|nr:aldo/keto reductase [Amycolatopsis rhizosphaerae]